MFYVLEDMPGASGATIPECDESFGVRRHFAVTQDGCDFTVFVPLREEHTDWYFFLVCVTSSQCVHACSTSAEDFSDEETAVEYCSFEEFIVMNGTTSTEDGFH